MCHAVREHIGVVTTVLVSQSHAVSSHVSVAEQAFRKSGTWLAFSFLGLYSLHWAGETVNKSGLFVQNWSE